jgi:hypothetical protein
MDESWHSGSILARSRLQTLSRQGSDHATTIYATSLFALLLK